MRVIRNAAARLLAPLGLALALVLSPPAATADAGADADKVAALIPEGAVTAEILTPDYSQQMQEISRRMLNAAQADPVWFQNWIAQHPRGTMPWHPNLGITKPEFDLYMRESRAAKFTIRTRVRLTFVRDHRGTHIWTLQGWGLLTPINGLVIDLDHGRAVSPRWGDLPFMGLAQPTDPSLQLPWNWYGVFRAAHVVGDPRKSGQSLVTSVHVGPLGDGRMVGMYWSSRRLNRGRQLADEFLLLRFPAPKR